MLRLNIGCGIRIFDGWVNIDIEDNGQEIVSDIFNIPLPHQCASEILSVHVIEHIPVKRVTTLLGEWKRLLIPGGFIAIECPDILKCCRNIAQGVYIEESMRGIYGDLSFDSPYQIHRWGWTYNTLFRMLNQVGFQQIQQSTPQWKFPNRDMRIEAWSSDT